MQHLSELVGFRGAYETLRELESSSVTDFSADELESILSRNGVEAPASSMEDLVAGNLLRRFGDSYALTTLGIRTCLLLEAVNGGDLKDIYGQLTRLDSGLRTYELIQEGMTEVFLRNLHDRPGFGRLYFCSPWISLNGRQEEYLSQAVAQVERRRGTRPEILVITRPEQGTDTTPPPGTRIFKDLGAAVYLSRRLHTKLYIREPDRSGGYAMAIVGSQNLTTSRYLELGIRINSDSQILTQLVAYFLELANYCHEVG